MSQIRYAMLDIKRNPGRYFLFMIEIVISFLLITMAVISLFDMADNARIYQETLGGRPMYLLKDLTSPDKLSRMRESTGITDRMADFYAFLTEHHEDYTVGTMEEPVEPGSTADRCEAVYANKHRARVLLVSPSFFDFYKLQIAEGEGFAPADYRTVDPPYIPAVLGPAFKEVFALGDSFETLENKYKVCGFLAEDSSYYQLDKSPDIYSLDGLILSPLNIAQYRKDKDFARLHQAITGTYIESSDPAEMRAIIEKSAELGLYDLAYQSFEDQMQYILGKFNLHLQLLVFLIVIILTFSTIGMTANIILFIQSSLKEFSIHMLCGAKKSTIILRIAIPFALIWLIALIFTGWYLRHAAATLLAALIMAVILAVIILVSVKELQKDNIEKLLRRAE